MKHLTYSFAGGGAFCAPNLCWRLRCTGLPGQLSRSFSEQIEKWIRDSGVAWTVLRLKEMRNDLLRMKAGLEPLGWYRRCKYGNNKGDWFGVTGAIFRYSKKDEASFKRSLIAFSIYTGFRPTKPTDLHVAAMRASVEEGTDNVPSQLSAGVALLAKSKLGFLTLNEAPPLITFGGSPGVNSPGETHSHPSNCYLEGEMDWLGGSRTHQKFLDKYEDCYSPVLKGLNWSTHVSVGGLKFRITGLTNFGWIEPEEVNPPLPIAGNVVPLMKDGGFKVRWIANPFRLHQLALKPLGDALFKSIKNLPWDCTFQQEKPLAVIQESLRNRKTVHSVDLSSATDRFPLSIQLDVLSQIIPKMELVHLFRDLSRAQWRSPYGPVVWSVGQPMGLYPSFPSFALTHGMLLLYLNKGRHNNCFFVLGDDVVILNDDLHVAYREALRELGCPVSEGKSISSPLLAEFAGKIISADFILPKFKLGSVESHHDSFMELYRTYGQGFRFFFGKTIRTVLEALSPLQEPWGANLSIGPAMSVQKSVAETDSLEEELSEDKGGSHYVGFLNLLASRLKPARKTSLWHLLRKEVLEIAERFVLNLSVAQQQVPRIPVPYKNKRDMEFPLLHPDLTDVLEFTGINTLDLLATDGQPPVKGRNRVTLLKRCLRFSRVQKLFEQRKERTSALANSHASPKTLK